MANIKCFTEKEICYYLDGFCENEKEFERHLKECKFCQKQTEEIREKYALEMRAVRESINWIKKVIAAFQDTWKTWTCQKTLSVEGLKFKSDEVGNVKKHKGETADGSIYWVIEKRRECVSFMIATRSSELKSLNGVLKAGRIIKHFSLIAPITKKHYGYEYTFSLDEQKLLPENIEDWEINLGTINPEKDY